MTLKEISRGNWLTMHLHLWAGIIHVQVSTPVKRQRCLVCLWVALAMSGGAWSLCGDGEWACLSPTSLHTCIC